MAVFTRAVDLLGRDDVFRHAAGEVARLALPTLDAVMVSAMPLPHGKVCNGYSHKERSGTPTKRVRTFLGFILFLRRGGGCIVLAATHTKAGCPPLDSTGRGALGACIQCKVRGG